MATYNKNHGEEFMYDRETLIFTITQFKNILKHGNTVISMKHYRDRLEYYAKNVKKMERFNYEIGRVSRGLLDSAL